MVAMKVCRCKEKIALDRNAAKVILPPFPHGPIEMRCRFTRGRLIMRKHRWLAALLTSIALVLPSLAQQPATQRNANEFFTGVNPRAIKTVKIDPNRAMQRNTLGHAMLPPVAQKKTTSPFSLGSYFPRVTVASWPPRLPAFSKNQTPAFPKPTQVPPGNVKLFNQPPK
jgi:hypothetical protein